MTLRHKIWHWFNTTDSNAQLPTGLLRSNIGFLCDVWLPGWVYPRPMRLSCRHEFPYWVDAQGRHHHTRDTRWRAI